MTNETMEFRMIGTVSIKEESQMSSMWERAKRVEDLVPSPEERRVEQMQTETPTSDPNEPNVR